MTRRKAWHRHVLNEDDVISLVGKYGFEVIENEGLSFEKQVSLYANTRIYIGIMGANLTNVIFMRPGSTVLQLTRRGDASNNLFYSLAAAKGVDSYYQQCDYVEAGYGIRWDLTVDLEELRANIDRMLAPATSG